MRYVHESHLRCPPEAVFHFHESPSALELLTPPDEPLRVAQSDGSLQVGSRVVLTGKLGPWPLRWVALHTEYEPPHLFADRQESGPFAHWYHRHRFLEDGEGGTILRDEVDCTPPLPPVGEWLGGWWLRRKLERLFRYRHEVTRRQLAQIRD